MGGVGLPQLVPESPQRGATNIQLPVPCDMLESPFSHYAAGIPAKPRTGGVPRCVWRDMGRQLGDEARAPPLRRALARLATRRVCRLQPRGYVECVGESIYRVPAPKPPVPPDPYLLAWASLHRRRVTMWISFVVWVPMGIVEVRLLGGFGFSILFLNMAVFVVSLVMASRFRCPHCLELFAQQSMWGIHIAFEEAFVRCCVHCGIRVGTPRSAVVAAGADDSASATSPPLSD